MATDVACLTVSGRVLPFCGAYTLTAPVLSHLSTKLLAECPLVLAGAF